MQALTPISFSFAFFCLLMLHSVTSSAANTYRQVELQHRNASSLQQSLQPLASDELVIIAEGNSLILKGPKAELTQLLGIIKSLDRPPKQLVVSVYRGIDPSALSVGNSKPHQNQRWSTNTGKTNRVDTILMEEGTTLVISESQLYSVPLETAEAVASIQPEEDKGTDLHSRYQRDDILLVEKGFTLVATLVKDKKGKQKVSLKTTYVLPSSAQAGETQKGKPLSLSTETSTVALVDIEQWQLLSSHQQQSHRPGFTGTGGKKTSYVYSTQKKGEFDYKVWVKFTVQ